MRPLVLVGCWLLNFGVLGPAHAQSGMDPGNSIVRCESSDGRTRECPADTSGGIRMLRQISRAVCTEGQTWGAGRGGIWVTQGCRGEFATGYGSSSSGGYGAQVLRCESSDGLRKLCAFDAHGDVQLVRQLSRSACVRNQSWGTNQRGVWVSQGCRAEFRIGGGYDDDEARNDNREQVVRCESPRGARNQCRVDVRGGVRLLRQLSSAPCVEGRTWGRDRAGIWVTRGCRAEFEIAPRTGLNLDDQDHGVMARVMRCESTDGQQRRCDVLIARGAQLTRQLSRSPCVEGQNWGWDRNGVWVAQGCRAEFSVW